MMRQSIVVALAVCNSEALVTFGGGITPSLRDRPALTTQAAVEEADQSVGRHVLKRKAATWAFWQEIAESVPRALGDVSKSTELTTNETLAKPRLGRRGLSAAALSRATSVARSIATSVRYRRAKRTERRSYLVDAKRLERNLSRALDEVDTAEEGFSNSAEIFARVSPPAFGSITRFVDSLKGNELLLRDSSLLSEQRRQALDIAMLVEEYDVGNGTAVVPDLADVAAFSPSLTTTSRRRDSAEYAGVECRLDDGLEIAHSISQRITDTGHDFLFTSVAQAALCIRSRRDLGRLCRDEQLATALVDRLMVRAARRIAKNATSDDADTHTKFTIETEVAANALAHLVALDSATSRAPLVRGGSVGASEVSLGDDGDVACWLCRQPGFFDAIGRLLCDERGSVRRAALRLALRLASHTGNGGDDAIAAMRSRRRIRRYVARMTRKANAPARARWRVAGARASCAKALRAYTERDRQGRLPRPAVEREETSTAALSLKVTTSLAQNASTAEQGIEANNVGATETVGKFVPSPAPTLSGAYWKGKRGMLSPPLASDAYEKELRDATKLHAALGLRRLSRHIDVPTPVDEFRHRQASVRPLGFAGLRRLPNVRLRVRRRRGVRVLCLDGGGTRGVITIEILRQLQQRCFSGLEPHEVFDLIVGTSTGAILAVLLGAKQCTLANAAGMYDKLVSRIFVKKSVQGSTMLVLRRAYYDERNIEAVFDELLGDDDFLDSAEQPWTPAIACLATLLSVSPSTICLLRNYEYPAAPTFRNFLGRRLFGTRHRATSRYPGSCKLPMRDALRAATAAPTLFTPVALRGQLLCDGALISNNPSSVAMHEAAALFPGVPVEVIVSVGTGEMQPVQTTLTSLNWEGIIKQLVDSATSTSVVHDVLTDLAPQKKYYRFNPSIPASPIDATDEVSLAAFRSAAQRYFSVLENAKRATQLANTLRIRRQTRR